MKQHEQAQLLLKKACEDEALLQEVLASERVSDEIFGFHSSRLPKTAQSITLRSGH